MAGEAFQLVLTGVLEAETGAHDDVFDGLRNKDLAVGG